MQVTKRNGTLEPYSVEKIHKVVEWATDGLAGVSSADVEMNANLSLYDKIPTEDIHSILVKSANDLISEQAPNYQYVAARLLNMQIRKEVWKGETPPNFLQLIKLNIDNGVYDPDIIKKWTEQDIAYFEGYIDHDRDDNYTYAGLQQMVDKYLIKNRDTHQLYETPQFAYMLIAMCLFDDPTDVKKAYDCYSNFIVSLATPIIAGVRSVTKQFASCVLIDSDDDLKSIFASASAMGIYTGRRAGIGVNAGRIRPINAPVRGGEVLTTGLIPYLKHFETAVKCTSQNGLRGGSANANVPFWHYEIEDVIVLKNNAGTDDNRVRKLDYTIQFCKLFYDRLVNDEEITLFNPKECKGLYEAFGNNEEFERLYTKYENAYSIKFKKKISARKFIAAFAKERLETGRIYSMNIDSVNDHGAWNIPVKMTNLCVEITQPTKPITNVLDENGEIGICILSAINLLEINSDQDIQKACAAAVNTLEAIIDYQEYPIIAGENFTKNRRSLGIGVTNLAGYLAKQKVSYKDPEALTLVHELMEKIQWNLINESCKLAAVKGACAKFEDTKYAQGQMPIDWYKKSVDELVKPVYNMDWKGLRERVKEHGLRHSTLSAQMPCESSSVVQNSTNGIEPIRSLLSYKKAKNGNLKQLVPNFYNHRKFYDLAWEFTDNRDIMNISAVMQKFLDMGMSTNLYYNYEHYPEGNIPLSVIVKDQVYGYKYGLKNFYYANTPDGDGDTEKEMGCEGGACSI